MTIAGIAAGGALLMEVIQEARWRVKQTLADAEAVADKTRATLEQTERALHNVRTAI